MRHFLQCKILAFMFLAVKSVPVDKSSEASCSRARRLKWDSLSSTTEVPHARCLRKMSLQVCKALFGSVAADSSRPCITTLHISLISSLFSKGRLFFLFSPLIPLSLHLNIPLLTKVWRLLVTRSACPHSQKTMLQNVCPPPSSSPCRS